MKGRVILEGDLSAIQLPDVLTLVASLLAFIAFGTIFGFTGALTIEREIPEDPQRQREEIGQLEGGLQVVGVIPPDRAVERLRLVRLTPVEGGIRFEQATVPLRQAAGEALRSLELGAADVELIVLPGEIMKVFILKEGKEYNQGVAYLDDGTMVVVDNARKMISKTIDVVVTSVLQTTAGKMIFGKFDERAQRPGPAPAAEPRKPQPVPAERPRFATAGSKSELWNLSSVLTALVFIEFTLLLFYLLERKIGQRMDKMTR